ncbi:hypothetical protein ARMGADRAFT_1047540 [Armillaria gallica]|uniref:CCHC-type domain-containing protein n=1 Tax=Armillaria gallica TaxID=47427 RepID=A0A2H3D8Y6_ARMGA|nr:hypothetical protein ARMGADRAFT_1047540 [Armillaria gallica]
MIRSFLQQQQQQIQAQQYNPYNMHMAQPGFSSAPRQMNTGASLLSRLECWFCEENRHMNADCPTRIDYLNVGKIVMVQGKLLQELGVHDIQINLCELCGSKPKAYTSSAGNHLYVNDIQESIAWDMSNPEIVKHLQFYPEDIGDGPISEVWQAQRWKEFHPSQLTPMFSRGHRHFYIEEVTQLWDRSMVLPHNLIKFKGAPCSDCQTVSVSPNGWTISLAPLKRVYTSEFLFNYEDIISCVGDDITWIELTNGEDLYVVMVPLWGNDHINIYMANSYLPGQLLQQEYFMWFVSRSPHATSPEHDTHKNLIKCYYTKSDEGQNCQVILQTPCLPADNPQQSEEASNIEQILCSMYGINKDVASLQTKTGTKDKKVKALKHTDPNCSLDSIVNELSTWLKDQLGDKINLLLDIPGLDPSQDTPVEILHTVLLGIIKYVWHMLNTPLTDAQCNLIAIHLQSTDIDGLTIPPLQAGYMMQYQNNLIGKHFKMLMQTLPFHLHGLVTLVQLALVKPVSALSPLLWVHEIPNMTEYLHDIEIMVGNVLDLFSDNDLAKIIVKIKLHLLTHICQDIPCFGPPIQNSTEVFKGFNAIFRLCSILSNHQVLSRDIAFKFASMDRLKHMLRSSILKVLCQHSILQHHLGWVPATEIEPGRIWPLSQKTIKKTQPILWKNTKVFPCLQFQIQAPAPTSQWHLAQSVTAQNEDHCIPGSWVFGYMLKVIQYTDLSLHQTHEIIVGRIMDILYCVSNESAFSESSQAVVIVDQFVLGEKLHPDLQCSVLCRPITDSQVQVLGASDILFLFNAQHDCHIAGCEAIALRAHIQE